MIEHRVGIEVLEMKSPWGYSVLGLGLDHEVYRYVLGVDNEGLGRGLEFRFWNFSVNVHPRLNVILT